jgi:hypothetical protein
MIFIYEIADENVQAIEQYLHTQIRVETDEVTKAQKMTPMFPGGVQEFVSHQLTNLAEQILTQYPTPALREAMVQEAALKKQRRDAVAPKALTPEQYKARL